MNRRSTSPGLGEMHRADAMQSALALQRRGELDAAERTYRRLLHEAPRHADAWHMLGVTLLQKGLPQQAAAAIRQAGELRPDQALIWCNLATALLEIDDRDDALRLLDRALSLDPLLLLARCNRALLMEKMSRHAEARNEWQAVLRQAPDHVEAHYRLARLEVRQGRFIEARDVLQAMLRLAPRESAARNLLGVALLGLGQYPAALEELTLALQIDPLAPGTWVNHGNALHKLGQFEPAVASYSRALELDPSLTIAWANRATTRVALRQPRAALPDAERALDLDARSPAALNAHGAALLALHRAEAALASFDAALALDATQALTHANRAAALIGLRRGGAALEAAQRALLLEPGQRQAALCQAGALLELEQPEEALDRVATLLSADPDDAQALYLQASVLTALRQYAAARHASERALLLAPEDATAWAGHAALMLHEQVYDATVKASDRALELGDPSAPLLNNRATALTMLQRHAEAEETLGRLLQLDPGYPCALGERLAARLRDCDWRDYADSVARVEQALHQGLRADAPFNTLHLPVGPDVQRLCAEATVREALPARTPLWRGERYSHGRTRVAYLSADLHAHATAYLMAGLLERHDRREFETYGVSYGPEVNDAVRQRLRGAFDHFLDVRLASDREIAQRLRDLEIDIAVDLKGYTHDGRLRILSYRPAPVQVTYLGYPGTLGTEFIDYVLADRVVIPAEDGVHYGERVAYLPHCYQATDDRREIAPRTPSRADCGLPASGFVFCCLNAVVKIAPPVFDVWMRLLTEVDGSVLWLLDSHEAAVRNLRAAAAARGVDPTRLVFAPRMPQAEHLARYRLADLFLDTLPYNAHTTASDALWAGLPVLTCRGKTFAARVGASILQAVGLQALVTSSLAEYHALARTLAREPGRLAGLRQQLAENLRSCPLFDTDGFRRNLEAAYREMGARQQRGEKPASFTVSESTCGSRIEENPTA